MRSYYAHLQTTALSRGAVLPKPVFRSSAIFPVFHQDGVTSRLLFVGYWLLKRNIKEIHAVLTLRALHGEILARHDWAITEAKSYRLELSDLLKIASLSLDKSFTGSMEIEFYSHSNMVFPYPAVVINYYGPSFSTVVHSAQRTYNDFDDMQKNSQTCVPESGFNIYADSNHQPFIGVINGMCPVQDGCFTMEFLNKKGQKLSHTIEMGDLAPYQTMIIYPTQEIPLDKFLNGEVGSCKAHFNVSWIFPRLLVGNMQKSPQSIAITHTYYDCSALSSDSDYWPSAPEEWFPASLMVPVMIRNTHFTNVYFYPIYPQSKMAIDVEFYDAVGTLMGRKQEALVLTCPKESFSILSMKDVLRELDISPNKDLAARLIARPLGESRLPSRIKIGLDIGAKSGILPCNICTNFQPFNPSMELKPSTFKWAPLLADQPYSTIWLMNSSPHKIYSKSADVHLSFFRESDTKVLQRQLSLPPHGFSILSPEGDREIKEFFEDCVGWVTATTNNAYLTTYYFNEHTGGTLGGDHGF